MREQVLLRMGNDPFPVQGDVERDDDEAQIAGQPMKRLQRFRMPQTQANGAGNQDASDDDHDHIREKREVEDVVQPRLVEHLAEKVSGDADHPVPVQGNVDQKGESKRQSEQLMVMQPAEMLLHLDGKGDQECQIEIEIELIWVATQFSDHIQLSENGQRAYSSRSRAAHGYINLK